MKTLQLTLVLLGAAMLTACSPRVAQPPPLDELEPPMVDSTVGDDLNYLGPDDYDTTTYTEVPAMTEYTGDEPLPMRTTGGEWMEDGSLETVYFGYDQFRLDDDASRTLSRNAQYLLANPSYSVRIEGNCDERGTDEYNQALGENRALSVREYLIGMGVEPHRIEVFSYGEYNPAVDGTGESAWRWNRRADFKVR